MMKKMLNTIDVALVIIGVYLLMVGCTVWREEWKKYETKELVEQYVEKQYNDVYGDVSDHLVVNVIDTYEDVHYIGEEAVVYEVYLDGVLKSIPTTSVQYMNQVINSWE